MKDLKARHGVRVQELIDAIGTPGSTHFHLAVRQLFQINTVAVAHAEMIKQLPFESYLPLRSYG